MANIAGVDEAGRGPLAGGVFAAAVILPESSFIEGLDDSKKLSAEQRTRMAELIYELALDWHISSASALEVDELNILQASLLAMKRAITGLSVPLKKVLVDGLHLPNIETRAEAIVKGDCKIPSIAAASVLAKVKRDEEMLRLDAKYPGYGFANNKGYPTKFHLRALEELGATPIHRRSFAPVKKIIDLADGADDYED